MEQTKKNEMLNALNAKRATMDSAAQERNNRELREAPLMKGDKVTFTVPEGKSAADLYDVVTESINWDYVMDSVGRRVSCNQLFGAPRNGMPYDGKSVKERTDTFLEALEDAPGRTLTFNVYAVRVSPSTNPEYNGKKYITWQPA